MDEEKKEPVNEPEKKEEKLEEKESNLEEKPKEKKSFLKFLRPKKTKIKETPNAITEKAEEKKIEDKQAKKLISEKSKPRFRINSSWYDKHYKKLLFISLAVLVLSLVYICFFYAVHHDIMLKDVTLTGGTAITVYTDKAVDVEKMASFLDSKLAQASIRILEDITTRKQIAIVVETKAEATLAKAALEEFLDYKLTEENSSIEVTGASLGQNFYRQLLFAVVIAFIFMSAVVLIIFKTPIPCLAVVLAAVTDIIGALAIANLFGFRISTAGIAAFLMLIGYSVDTDLMLTTKVIKRKGEGALNSRIKASFKTGMTMTLTSLVAVLIAFFISQSAVLKQIFFILSAGLFIDLISTWLGNASILKWWCEKKHIS